MHSKFWAKPVHPDRTAFPGGGMGRSLASSRELMSGFIRFMIFHGEKSVTVLSQRSGEPGSRLNEVDNDFH
jgi:hypothetical protein